MAVYFTGLKTGDVTVATWGLRGVCERVVRGMEVGLKARG